jgi:hypothetical protein
MFPAGQRGTARWALFLMQKKPAGQGSSCFKARVWPWTGGVRKPAATAIESATWTARAGIDGLERRLLIGSS